MTKKPLVVLKFFVKRSYGLTRREVKVVPVALSHTDFFSLEGFCSRKAHVGCPLSGAVNEVSREVDREKDVISVDYSLWLTIAQKAQGQEKALLDPSRTRATAQKRIDLRYSPQAKHIGPSESFPLPVIVEERKAASHLSLLFEIAEQLSHYVLLNHLLNDFQQLTGEKQPHNPVISNAIKQPFQPLKPDTKLREREFSGITHRVNTKSPHSRSEARRSLKETRGVASSRGKTKVGASADRILNVYEQRRDLPPQY